VVKLTRRGLAPVPPSGLEQEVTVKTLAQSRMGMARQGPFMKVLEHEIAVIFNRKRVQMA
jgi:hypothetical protein